MQKQKRINIKTTIGMPLAGKYIAKYDLDIKGHIGTESKLVNRSKEELEKQNKKNYFPFNK